MGLQQSNSGGDGDGGAGRGGPTSPRGTVAGPPSLSSSPSAADSECVICYETVTARTELPCACRVDYCAGCWDSALAQSFNACGQARCPTCRAPVRVDFDAESARLLFSPQPQEEEEDEMEEGDYPMDDGGGEREEMQDDHAAHRSGHRRALRNRNRLIEQARPAQVRILERYGLAYPLPPRRQEEQVPPQPQEQRELPSVAASGTAAAWSAEAAAAAVEASTAPPPQCVCGGVLERVSSHERARRLCVRLVPQCPPGSPYFERIVEHINSRGQSFIHCDLCRQAVPCSHAVWTCTSGNSTILHANAYDVCDPCFVRHAHGLATSL